MSDTKAVVLGKRNDCPRLLPLSPLAAGTSDTRGDLPWVQLGLVRKRTEQAGLHLARFRRASQPLRRTQPCVEQCGTVALKLAGSELPRTHRRTLGLCSDLQNRSRRSVMCSELSGRFGCTGSRGWHLKTDAVGM